MNGTPQVADYLRILPEIVLSVFGMAVMLLDPLLEERRRAKVLGGVGLVGALVALVSTFCMAKQRGPAFWNMVQVDSFSVFFHFLVIAITVVVVLSSYEYMEVQKIRAGEYYALMLFGAVGMCLMSSAVELVLIFIALEISSISTYILAGFRRRAAISSESSVKYFLLGSFATAFFLYGVALMFGATGSTSIAVVSTRLQAEPTVPVLAYAAFALMFVGLGFKVAAAPFHVWTPDVYEGAPTPVTAFMAAGPKAAGFAAFMRVFLFGFPIVTATATTAGYAHATWVGALAIMAALTMSIGNVVAIVQNNVKRMLAYSSIAHAGYALVGFVAAGAANDEAQRGAALTAVAFYLLTYAVMNMGAFAIVTVIARKGDLRNNVDDYNGIGFSSPVLAFSLSLFLLSLLGMPLTAGFMGKIMVFSAAVNQGYVWLVVIGVLNTAISAYYYLRLIVVMFFREPTGAWEAPRIPAAVAVALILTILGVFYLGLFPGRVISIFSPRPSIAVSVR